MGDLFYDRTKRLIGQDALAIVQGASVLVAGLGGVGGYVVENLVRAGVGTIGLCDFDRIDPTNLNRQILAVSDTIGQLKTEAAARRCRSINPDVRLRLFPFRIDETSIHELDLAEFDWIADAIDDVPAKVQLLQTACNLGKPIISAMGCGNKLDATRLRIAPLSDTHTCPLAKALRKKLRGTEACETMALFSDETALLAKRQEPDCITASISYMPAVAGSLMAGHIVTELIGR